MRDRVSHRAQKPLLVAPATWPTPPKEWLAVTRRDWADFGQQDIAGLVQSADMPSLRYLFELRDRRERWLRVTRGAGAISKGYMKQDVLNPLLRQMPALNKEIRALEQQFAMTPGARKQMGLTRAVAEEEQEARPSLGELLDSLDDDDDQADPRLMVLDGGR